MAGRSEPPEIFLNMKYLYNQNIFTPYLVGSGGVGLLDGQGSVVAGPVVWLRVGGGLEVLLQQI